LAQFHKEGKLPPGLWRRRLGLKEIWQQPDRLFWFLNLLLNRVSDNGGAGFSPGIDLFYINIVRGFFDLAFVVKFFGAVEAVILLDRIGEVDMAVLLF